MNEISVPALVEVPANGNLTQYISERASLEPNRITMSRPLGDGWQPVTAREVEQEIRAVAKGLVASGINAGDRVAIMARTRYEWTILDFAIWYAGGCVVPIYETSSAEQIDWILNDSGSVGIIAETPTHRELVETVKPSHTKHVWTMTEDILGALSLAGAQVGRVGGGMGIQRLRQDQHSPVSAERGDGHRGWLLSLSGADHRSCTTTAHDRADSESDLFPRRRQWTDGGNDHAGRSGRHGQ